MNFLPGESAEEHQDIYVKIMSSEVFLKFMVLFSFSCALFWDKLPLWWQAGPSSSHTKNAIFLRPSIESQNGVPLAWSLLMTHPYIKITVARGRECSDWPGLSRMLTSEHGSRMGPLTATLRETENKCQRQIRWKFLNLKSLNQQRSGKSHGRAYTSSWGKWSDKSLLRLWWSKHRKAFLSN